MNFLITAGPTREYLDPVRFISNPSSGRMGIAVAEQAKRKGHKVTLIMGCCTVEPPRKVTLVKVTTAREMREAVLKYLDRADVLVMSAAVGDWKVLHKSRQKIKKNGKAITLKLTANPDILTEAGRLKRCGRKIFLAGFSVDTMSLAGNAKKKLREKNLDLIVANTPDTFGSKRIKAVIIDRQGKVTSLPLVSKKRLAGRLVEMIESMCEAKPRTY